MVSPTLSLRTQLLITFVWSIVVAVVALTAIAYKTANANLQRDAQQTVLVASQNRAEAVSRSSTNSVSARAVFSQPSARCAEKWHRAVASRGSWDAPSRRFRNFDRLNTRAVRC